MTVMEERKSDLSDTSNPMLSECVRIIFLLLNVHQTKSDIQTSTLLSPRASRLKRENTTSSAHRSPKLDFSPHEVDLLTCLFKTIQ
ncbi:hypothetical protein HW132_35465 [Brasilonema sp. CT11]|nr:hypothetical protein [Brasilonema sp. CT11]